MRKTILVLLTLIISIMLVGCGSSDMKGVKNLTQQQIYEQKEDKYYIFFYREGCSGCEDTKPYILAYIKALKSGDYPGARMYVANHAEGGQGTDGRFWVDGVSNWSELKIGSTPSLITVYIKDGVKVSQYAAQGKDKITDVLNNQLLVNKK